MCLPLLFNQPFIVGYYGLLPNIFVDDANDSVSGTDVEAIKLLADKYQMKLEFQNGDGGDFTSITTKNATHNLAKIKDPGRYNNPGNPADFFLLTFTSFVEPDKINWFPTWSAGKMSALMWSVFALLVVSFYTSNLRTNLIAPSLEPEINSHEDILKYGKFIHANNLFLFLRQQKVSPAFEAVLRWVDETGGWFRSEADEGSLEPHVETGVLKNGDVYFTNDENVLYSYLFQKTLGFPNLRISDDALNNFYMSIRLQKYSPYTLEEDRNTNRRKP
ncbi:hypothetical protein TCAL_12808 [Tigriopus californicus]|uniref:Ionotropic glutamate receptor C-terminal domain-containing protein n=1 Tax=Tigriopus californicus TaxID=6832 RepID=A0A553PQF6_TIGCA|nr:hypothetical protein TCAL_12808 [Tigriopus californicus]